MNGKKGAVICDTNPTRERGIGVRPSLMHQVGAHIFQAKVDATKVGIITMPLPLRTFSDWFVEIHFGTNAGVE